MKHIFKAIASALVWGLGQVFNKQFLKAAMFMVVFGGVVAVEICTSHYFEPRSYDVYEHYNGEYFHDANTRGAIMESFNREYIEKVNNNGLELDEAWKTVLIENNVITYEGGKWVINGAASLNLSVDELIKVVGIKVRSLYDSHIDYDEYGRVRYQSYLYEQSTNEKGDPINVLVVDELGRPVYDETSAVILDFYQTALAEAEKHAEANKVAHAKDMISTNWSEDKINQFPAEYEAALNKQIEISYGTLKREKYSTLYKQYYKDLIMSDSFLKVVKESFSNIAINTNLQHINEDDWSETLARIYYAAFPEEFEILSNRVDAYWNENGGVFGRALWALFTLGKSANISVNTATSMDMFCPDGIMAVEQTLTVHHSINLLIYAIVMVIVMLFLFVFYLWNVRDAYKSSVKRQIERAKAKEEGRKPVYQSDIEYFKEMYEECFPYFVLLPTVIIMAFITIMPIIFSLLIAFTNYDKNHLPTGQLVSWVGFDNFLSLFSFTGNGGIPFGDAFWKVLCWTIIWAIGSTFTCFFGGFIQAIIVNNERVIFRKFWRTVLILPWAVPALVSQMMFKLFFNADNGAMSSFLNSIGVTDFLKSINLVTTSNDAMNAVEKGDFIKKITFLGNNNIEWYSNRYNCWLPRIFIIVLNIWLGFPYFMAMMSGIMTSISKDLYEAAEIDGATKFQQFQKITVPLVLYSTAPLLIMSFSNNFNNFGVIYFITGGGTGTTEVKRAFAGSTDILISWIYRLTTDDTTRWYSMASVFSILIFIVVASISTWNFLRTKSFKEEDMM